MNTSVVYSYKGSEISFMNGDNVMVNATQMAKPFGKQPIDWLKTNQSKDYIETFSKLKFISLADLVQVIKGGNNPGTWMHEDVALEFARWLSPAFAIWCNDRIKELLKTGVVTISNDDETIAYAMQILNKRLEAAKQEKAMLEAQNNYLANEIKQAAPKVQYVDNVLQSVNTYTSTQLSKELGIMFKQSGQWMLTAKHSEKGYTKPRTTTYTRFDGSQGTNTITVWTERGRAFLHKVFTNEAQA